MPRAAGTSPSRKARRIFRAAVRHPWGAFTHPSAELQAKIRAMPHVSSLQITFHEGKASADHPMPPGGFRLGIVNCTDLAAGLAARRELAKAFPPDLIQHQD
jgi:hypothetical protein